MANLPFSYRKVRPRIPIEAAWPGGPISTEMPVDDAFTFGGAARAAEARGDQDLQDYQDNGDGPSFAPSNTGPSPEWQQLQQRLQSAGFPEGTVEDYSYPNVTSPQSRKIAAAGGDPNQGTPPFIGEREGIDPQLVNRVAPDEPIQMPQQPAVVTPAVTTPPVDPTAGSVGQDYGGTGLVRERRVETDKQGRPMRNPKLRAGTILTDPETGQPIRDENGEIQSVGDLDQDIDYQNRLRQYQPQKAHGWRRYLLPILAGWAAGSAGSRDPRSAPWAGLGGAITGALTGQFHPEAANEM